MQWHEFIFSEKKQPRLLRHLLFWVLWISYFLLYDYLLQQQRPWSPIYGRPKTGYVILDSHFLLKTLLLISVYAIACYVFIYALLPQLLKGRWLSATVKIILLCTFLFVIAWFLYWNVFPFIDSLSGDYKVNDYFARFWPAFYLGIVNASKVIVSAAIIKYVKYWWVTQKEKEKLEREKLNAELQLLKAQVHPDFLFKALNNIYVYSLAASPRASGLLLKLSDLLSYMLYECDKPLVPLDKEIDMMKDYMAMEKIRLDESFEMELNVMGNVSGKMIAPFLLLPFIENSFKQSSHMNGNSWINMDISMEEDSFHMKLANGMMPGTNGSQELPANGLTNVQKRLTLLYPQKHELKTSGEQEMFIVHLQIQLSDITGLANDKYEEPEVEELV